MSDQPSRVGTVRRYVFYNEHRPSRAWMPTLEAINERFAQHLRTVLLQTLRCSIGVTPPTTIRLMKHNDLLAKLVMPSHLALAGLKPLRGAILVALDAPLISWIVESRFGGDGRFPISSSNREFSAFEQKSASRVVQTVIEQLAVAWQPIASLEPRIVRHESNAQFVAIANPSEQVIVSTFEVQVGQGGGKLTVCIPYRMLEPLHERLISDAHKDAVEPDQRWNEVLTVGIGQAMTTLRVELTKLQVTVGDLLDLQPGSIFNIERPEIVTVEANGVPLFRGRWGKQGRRIAVRVEERLQPPADVFVPKQPEGNEGRRDDG
jgi:flagellar motor switch protein FliM